MSPCRAERCVMGLSGELEVDATASEPRRCREDSKREVMEEEERPEEIEEEEDVEERAGGRTEVVELGDMVEPGLLRGNPRGREEESSGGATAERDYLQMQILTGKPRTSSKQACRIVVFSSEVSMAKLACVRVTF